MRPQRTDDMQTRSTVVQPLAGGLGTFLVVGVVGLMFGGLPILIIGPWALTGGVLIAGSFMIVRAFPSELTYLACAVAEKFAAYRNKSEVETLRAQMLVLQHELAQAKNGDAPDDADRALAIAYQVLHDFYYRKLPMSYEACNSRNACSRQTWEWLHSLLVAAKVKDANGKVLVQDFGEAWQRFGDTYANSNRRVRTATGKFISAAPRHLLPTRN